MREVPADSPFAEDIALLQSQSDRCREILAELARRPEPASAPFDSLPLPALLEAAILPYKEASIAFVVEASSLDGSAVPVIPRSPELLHGLGNILQNAMQFARRSVTTNATWSNESVCNNNFMTMDPGFPANLIDRLGEPYISTRTDTGGASGPRRFYSADPA